MKSRLKVLILTLFVMLAAVFAMAASFTGTVTDTMCTKKHMMPGKSDADCARECARHGGQWALVAGGKTYILKGDPAKISAVSGKKVAVTGDVKGTTIDVTSIAEAK